MDFELIKTRVISFAYGLVTLVAGALLTQLLAVFSGPEFHALVVQYFGDGVTSAFIFLVVSQIVAHVRNLVVLGRASRLGAAGRHEPFTLI